MVDRLAVLTAIYQSDRADRAGTFTVSLATMGAAVTYLVGTVAFYDKLDLLGWAIALLPFPLVCIAAFHSQLVALAAVRARSILSLERALLAATATDDGVDPDHIGVTASERATNVHTAEWWNRVAIVVAYGGVGVVYVAYTALMLVKSAAHLSGWVAVPAVAYAVLLAPLALAWKRGTAGLDFRAGPAGA
ncbi:hypothetical protein AB0I60_14730 [Actinosynnema sp. NPDC050436]|uniref:hypothetical protein n=1 Tax=Actinosynnema sp. NPDC050436 TaxID=3155659 RepID=UPI00340D644C